MYTIKELQRIENIINNKLRYLHKLDGFKLLENIDYLIVLKQSFLLISLIKENKLNCCEKLKNLLDKIDIK